MALFASGPYSSQIQRAMRALTAGPTTFGPGAMTFTGPLLFSPDNTYDIGASGATRPRTIYAGTSAVAPIFTASTGVNSAGYVLTGDGSVLGTQTRARFVSPADGVWTLYNAAQTDFSRLQFGGTTSSYPALKRNTTQLQVRLADDSDYAQLRAASYVLGGAQQILGGSGTPEGTISANVGSLYLRTDGGANTTLYVKESGASNTGWVAK